MVNTKASDNLIHTTLQQKGGLLLKGKGNSMFPTLHDGDMLFVVPSSIENIKKGQIILFSLENRLIAHRVIDKRKNDNEFIEFTLKGDMLFSSKLNVQSEQIVGQVVKVLRYHRVINLDSNKHMVMAFIFVKLNVAIGYLRLILPSFIKKWLRHYYYYFLNFDK